MQHTFDTTPLSRRLTVREMLRELKYSGVAFKIGFVMLLLVAFVPLVIFVLVASQVVTNLGALAFIVMLSAGGLWGLRDLYRELNEIATARQFAAANKLQFYRDL